MNPYDEGVVATSGMSEDSNPYAPGTDAHAEWADGYDSAIEAEQEGE